MGKGTLLKSLLSEQMAVFIVDPVSTHGIATNREGEERSGSLNPQANGSSSISFKLRAHSRRARVLMALSPTSTNIDEQTEYLSGSRVRGLASDHTSKEVEYVYIDILGGIVSEHGNGGGLLLRERREYISGERRQWSLYYDNCLHTHSKTSTRSQLKQHPIRLGNDERSVRTGRMDDIEAVIRTK